MLLQPLCTTRGLTLEQLAARAGLALATVVKVDAGAIRPQAIVLRRLGAALGLEPLALREAMSSARRHHAVAPAGSLRGW